MKIRIIMDSYVLGARISVIKVYPDKTLRMCGYCFCFIIERSGPKRGCRKPPDW